MRGVQRRKVLVGIPVKLRLTQLSLWIVAGLTFSCALAPATPGPSSQPDFSLLQFTPVSEEAASYFGYVAPRLVSSLREIEYGMPLAPMVPFAQSGPVEGINYLSYEALEGRVEGVPPMGDTLVRRTLVSVSEARLPGFAGSFTDLMATRVSRVVSTWADDARLKRGNVLQEELTSLKPVADGPCRSGYYGPPWDLIFVSAAKQESLRFLVDGSRTLVIRGVWQAAGSVMPALSKEQAIERLVTALRAREQPGWEQLSAQDYFEGKPYVEPSYSPSTETGLMSGPLYDVSAEASWTAHLQTILGKTVWILSTDHALPPRATTVPYHLLCSGPRTTPVEVVKERAMGLVDAQNGTVIRFVRPARVVERHVEAP